MDFVKKEEKNLDRKAWAERIGNRLDCTEYITHLTRRTKDKRTIEVLYDIIDSRKVFGSTAEGFVTGGPAACFQDVPLVAMANNIVFEENKNFQERLEFCDKTDWQYDLNDVPPEFRYEAFGIRVHKIDAYGKGARPVIYGDKRLFLSLFPSDEHWRLVDMNLDNEGKIIDWSHEREWRIKGDYSFSLKEIDIIVGCEQSKQELIEHYRQHRVEIEKEVKRIIILQDYITQNY